MTVFKISWEILNSVDVRSHTAFTQTQSTKRDLSPKKKGFIGQLILETVSQLANLVYVFALRLQLLV